MLKNSGQNRDIAAASKKIGAIYNEAIGQLQALEKEQRAIILDCIKKIEQEKIKQIRASLANNKT